MSLSESQQSAIDQALFKGNKIEAIKLYRTAMLCDLKDAKDAVEQREAVLRNEDSSRFTHKDGKSGCLTLVMLFLLPAVAVWLMF